MDKLKGYKGITLISLDFAHVSFLKKTAII